MKIKELCTKNVVTAQRFESLAVVARRMRDYSVGNVVIVDQQTGGFVPIGIVTDRDIVITSVAADQKPSDTLIEEIMGDELVTAHDTDNSSDVVELMKEHGVRRIPVINKQRYLVGIISMDDLLLKSTKNMKDLRAIPAQQRNWEHANSE